MAARVLGKESGGSDSRFFTTQKKGEMHELRLELHSTDRTVKVDAVKKVIASMTVGKDVSHALYRCLQLCSNWKYW